MKEKDTEKDREKRALIVFLKTPEKGHVKTRLSRTLDPGFVLDLYKGFVGDALEALGTAGDKIIYFWPPEKKTAVQAWLGKGYACFPQTGQDLGERMSNAFVDVFKRGYTRALLIGTDIPELCREIIQTACQTLDSQKAVIGPSCDGGYYLIGFQKSAFSKNIFSRIDWSTGLVREQTLRAMDRQSLEYGVLPKLNDIDTPENLSALISRVKKGGAAGARTLEILNRYED